MKGKFKPRHPEKYKGDPTNIEYRSSWELKLMSRLDEATNVIWWASEEVAIPYVSPLDNKIHRYYPDFIVKRRSSAGKIETIMIEVKPAHETRPPVKPAKPTRRFLTEAATWGKNQAKWAAARELCADRGWKFQIMTEKELGIASLPSTPKTPRRRAKKASTK